MRILIISGESFPGFEGRNLPIAIELIRRGHDVVHTGPTSSMKEQGFLSTTFNSSFADRVDAKEANTRLFSTWNELKRFIDCSQVVLFGTAKHYKNAADYARVEGKVILWHRDVGPTHIWLRNPHRVAVRGCFEIDEVKRHSGLDENDIRVTGCTQFDAAAPSNERLNKREFCEKYNLDPNKNTAVFLSATPAYHTDYVKKNYHQIFEVISSVANHNLILKPHPREFARAKQEQHYKETKTPTWRQWAPSMTACDPVDTYDCYRHSDVMIVSGSQAFMESALFHLPALDVNLSEVRSTDFQISLKEALKFIPAKRFSPPSRRVYKKFGYLQNHIKEFSSEKSRNLAAAKVELYKEYYAPNLHDFIGTECGLDELKEVLESYSYRIKGRNVFDEYVTEYCYANDGKAYLRVADFIEEVESIRQLAGLLKPSIKKGLGRLFRKMKRSLVEA